MPEQIATAIAHPNIALIKYWGDINTELHIPANGSISLNLSELTTHTAVSFNSSLQQDQFILNGSPMEGESLQRVCKLLDRVRQKAGISLFATVESINNFPISAGIASSASGFAALSLAGSRAAGLELDEGELSRLARTGSGSACRSIPGGFVEWLPGRQDEDSFARSFAPADYWNLVDCIAVVSLEEKLVSSNTGHSLAATSILQAARVSDAPRRLDQCRQAILERDFPTLAEIVELDSNLMHAVMITSSPPLVYWQPATVEVIQAVQAWRNAGIPACYTVDAGPNVHVLCLGSYAEIISKRLQDLPAVSQVIITHPGGPAALESGFS